MLKKKKKSRKERLGKGKWGQKVRERRKEGKKEGRETFELFRR